MKQATQKTDYNSTVNQQIKSEFVQREVYCNVNSLVEYCLKNGYEDRESPVNLDDIENIYSYPEYFGQYAKFSGGTENEKDAELERLSSLYDMVEDNIEGEEAQEAAKTKIDEEMQEIRDLESEPQEIYEWWAVSSYLYDKLKEQGEPVVDAGSCYVWGRTTTGQAILLDGVISRICSDMGILDGQAHSWAKK